MFAQDATTYLADFGDAVVWASNPAAIKPTGLMLFDQADAEQQHGDIISREYGATFETAAWPGLKREDRLVVSGSGGGLTYKLRTDPQWVEDGVFSHVKLSRVAA